MKVTHVLDEQVLEGECKDPSFLMTNKNKGFCWMSTGISSSRYQGVYFAEKDKIFRVIEDIQQCEEIIGIKNKFWCTERIGKTEHERFFMPDNLNCFSYESGKKGYVFLDFKEAYKMNYAEYKVEELESKIIVTINYEGKEYYLVISYLGKFSPIKRIIDRHYPYDENRKSYPADRKVFYLGDFEAERLFFSFSSSKEEAILNLLKEKEIVKLENKKKMRVRKTQKTISKDKVNVAYNACRLLLDNLYDSKGMIAGLPWFFQYWSRDELISAKAYASINKTAAKEIIKRWFKTFNEESLEKECANKKTGKFRIPSKQNQDGGFEGQSLDAFGWMLNRMEEVKDISLANDEKLLSFFDKLDTELIDCCGTSWMDSLDRKIPIEVQAMKLYAIKLTYKLTSKDKFKDIEKEFREKVRKQYYDNGWLFDFDNGWSDESDEKRIRPNIFIVYYFYPELLSKEEWELVFDNELPEMWADWGGFSTISTKDQLFHPTYTGEEPGSYHNGDSWFWINNLAGIVLLDLNKEKYYGYIKKILNASTQEILFSGAIGNHSELSSYNEMKSEGAPCQAFSAAMYVEFVEAMMGTK